MGISEEVHTEKQSRKVVAGKDMMTQLSEKCVCLHVTNCLVHQAFPRWRAPVIGAG